MKRKCFPAVIFLVAVSAVSAQTGSNALSTETKRAYEAVKKNLLATASKVPEEDLAFKPTPEMRTFGEVLGHVIMAQTHTCGALAPGGSEGGAQFTTKKEIQAGLQASFERCDKAYDALTDANALEMIKTPRGERTRVGTLAGNTTHDVEQYAALGVYMRLKGIVPPSSEK